LAQSYEETALLFSLARLMNAADPVGSLKAILERVQQIMSFGWVAIRFHSEDEVIAPLRGITLHAGSSAVVANERFDMMATALITAPDSRRILQPGRDALASITGAQVLAEPILHDRKRIGVIVGGNKTDGDPEISSFETQFIEATAGFLGIFHENLARFAEQKEAFFGTLRALTAAIDAKDPYTRGHSDRVGLLASMIAMAIGHDASDAEVYRTAGLVHDIGKIGVPEGVLCKRGQLTDGEYDQIKRHPTIGFNIMRDIPMLQRMWPGVLHHHERWDGRGYPAKLAGEEIPTIARVLAVCDTFDALSSTRSYRPALPREAVIAEIRKSAGTQLDPTIVDIFFTLDLSRYDAMLEGHTEAWSANYSLRNDVGRDKVALRTAG
jgi:HD-GYP domain-containing protein (c-di-GMP phosphodiesterase class II)